MDQAIAALSILHELSGSLSSSPLVNYLLPVAFRVAGVRALAVGETVILMTPPVYPD